MLAIGRFRPYRGSFPCTLPILWQSRMLQLFSLMLVIRAGLKFLVDWIENRSNLMKMIDPGLALNGGLAAVRSLVNGLQGS